MDARIRLVRRTLAQAPHAQFEITFKKPQLLRDPQTGHPTGVWGRRTMRFGVRIAGTKLWFVEAHTMHGLPRDRLLALWHEDLVEVRRLRENAWVEYFDLKKDVLHE